MQKEWYYLFYIESYNFLKSKWVWFYSLFIIFLIESFLLLSSDAQKININLFSVLLLVLPLVSLMYSLLNWYYSEGVQKLLLTLSIRRIDYLSAKFVSLSCILSLFLNLAFLLPLLIHQMFNKDILVNLILLNIIQTVFISIGILLANLNEDKLQGLGLGLVFWFLLTFLYDGLLLMFFWLAKDYPLEEVGLFLTFLNPINLIRLLFLYQFDFSFLMNYTGVILQKYFSSSYFILTSIVALLFWIFFPLFLAQLKFRKRDL